MHTHSTNPTHTEKYQFFLFYDKDTVSLITFGSQVIWQYKMDLFPVEVLGSSNYFVCQNCGGSEYKFWSFFNTHSSSRFGDRNLL